MDENTNSTIIDWRTKAIAVVAHNVNKALCESHSDFSQTYWDEAPDWQKESAINGVLMHINNPDATPEDSHKSWLAEKEATGWVYGDKKDAVKKTHPCIVPYNELPEFQRAKDYVFREIVHSLNAIF